MHFHEILLNIYYTHTCKKQTNMRLNSHTYSIFNTLMFGLTASVYLVNIFADLMQELKCLQTILSISTMTLLSAQKFMCTFINFCYNLTFKIILRYDRIDIVLSSIYYATQQKYYWNMFLKNLLLKFQCNSKTNNKKSSSFFKNHNVN